MIEDDIKDAIVAKFFEPSTGYTTQMVYDNTGSQRYETVPFQTEAPAMKVARTIWDANKQAITDAVMDRLDLNAIVEQCSEVITKAVIERLTAAPTNAWSAKPTPSERQKMLAKVYEQVAEEFGRQCVEHLKATGGLLAVLEA